ncbi:hypothetical protein Holit_01840 [Hollandina sp. SP2]
MQKGYIGFIITLSTFIFWYFISFLEEKISITENSFLRALLASVFSYTIYKIIINIFKYSGDKIEPLKKIFLGNEYLAGKWIGYYTGFSGNIRYFVETIEQDFGNITIRGNTYDENMNFHSTYTSEAVGIDGKNDVFIYCFRK